VLHELRDVADEREEAVVGPVAQRRGLVRVAGHQSAAFFTSRAASEAASVAASPFCPGVPCVVDTVCTTFTRPAHATRGTALAPFWATSCARPPCGCTGSSSHAFPACALSCA